MERNTCTYKQTENPSLKVYVLIIITYIGLDVSVFYDKEKAEAERTKLKEKYGAGIKYIAMFGREIQ